MTNLSKTFFPVFATVAFPFWTLMNFKKRWKIILNVVMLIFSPSSSSLCWSLICCMTDKLVRVCTILSLFHVLTDLSVCSHSFFPAIILFCHWSAQFICQDQPPFLTQPIKIWYILHKPVHFGLIPKVPGDQLMAMEVMVSEIFFYI